jgi:hypothetical protein
VKIFYTTQEVNDNYEKKINANNPFQISTPVNVLATLINTLLPLSLHAKSLLRHRLCHLLHHIQERFPILQINCSLLSIVLFTSPTKDQVNYAQ